MVLFFYAFALILLTVYSFALVDPNLTLVSNNMWVGFRDVMVNLGYHERETSWAFYFVIVIFLISFHLYFLRKYNKYNPLRIAIMVSFILLLSYPFLSHDFFNYIFDAKIFTFYHQNPYTHKPLDYPHDAWLRFMHWTHRTYPYGPTWLIVSIVPSFLSFGKFILNFIFFKLLFVSFYFLSVFCLSKINKKAAIFFATSPLVIIEGIVNAHNDLIATSFALIGACYLLLSSNHFSNLLRSYLRNDKAKHFFSFVHFLLSAGVKFITIPTLLIQKNKDHVLNKISFMLLISLVTYISYTSEIQPWYFLNVFIFLPFYQDTIEDFTIFFSGLIFSYYPFIRMGDWTDPSRIALKHQIIIIFLLLNAFYFIFRFFRSTKKLLP